MEQKVYELVAPVIEELGYLVWDVRYEKEGALWYLRVFIDSETDGIGIQDCEKVTEPVSTLLDEKDPIPQGYTLEISSPGLEADLVRESHFDACLGCQVRAKGYQNLANGDREAVGILKDWNKDGITLQLATEQEMQIPFSVLTFVKLYFAFDEM